MSYIIIIGIVVLIVWIVTSVLTYGYNLAYYQRQYPGIAEEDYVRDVIFALSLSVFPLAGYLATLNLGKTKHGLKFTRHD